MLKGELIFSEKYRVTFDDKFRNQKRQIEANSHSHDKEVAARLWEKSVALTQIDGKSEEMITEEV